MAICYNGVIVVVDANSSIGLEFIFDSSDFTNGGLFNGPVVIAATSIFPGFPLIASNATVNIIKLNSDGLTSNAIYSFTVQSDNPVPVFFNIEVFYSG
jgi:hypothetical protein